jgi:hypothetical protein
MDSEEAEAGGGNSIKSASRRVGRGVASSAGQTVLFLAQAVVRNANMMIRRKMDIQFRGIVGSLFLTLSEIYHN